MLNDREKVGIEAFKLQFALSKPKRLTVPFGIYGEEEEEEASETGQHVERDGNAVTTTISSNNGNNNNANDSSENKTGDPVKNDPANGNSKKDNTKDKKSSNGSSSASAAAAAARKKPAVPRSRHPHHLLELPLASAGLGCALWDGGLVLARWVYSRGGLLAGARVVELGCGVGLAGIVAGHWAHEVWLTDYIRETVRNAAYNVRLNTCCSSSDDETTTTASDSEEEEREREAEEWDDETECVEKKKEECNGHTAAAAHNEGEGEDEEGSGDDKDGAESDHVCRRCRDREVVSAGLYTRALHRHVRAALLDWDLEAAAELRERDNNNNNGNINLQQHQNTDNANSSNNSNFNINKKYEECGGGDAAGGGGGSGAQTSGYTPNAAAALDQTAQPGQSIPTAAAPSQVPAAAPARQVCTAAVTDGDEFAIPRGAGRPAGKALQEWFTCQTCWPGDDARGCCAPCAAVCHAGHDLASQPPERVRCDCYARESCRCLPPPSPLFPPPRTVDVLLGAELTYNLLSCETLACVVDRLLAPRGVFYEVLSDDRDGVSVFIAEMEKRGFSTVRHPAPARLTRHLTTREWSKKNDERYSLYTWRRRRYHDDHSNSSNSQPCGDCDKASVTHEESHHHHHHHHHSHHHPWRPAWRLPDMGDAAQEREAMAAALAALEERDRRAGKHTEQRYHRA